MLTGVKDVTTKCLSLYLPFLPEDRDVFQLELLPEFDREAEFSESCLSGTFASSASYNIIINHFTPSSRRGLSYIRQGGKEAVSIAYCVEREYGYDDSCDPYTQNAQQVLYYKARCVIDTSILYTT